MDCVPDAVYSSVPGNLACLLAGFVILLIGETEEMDKLGWGKLGVAAFLVLLFAVTYAYIFIMGLNLVGEVDTDMSEIMKILHFLLSIAMVEVFHFRILIDLYHEGEL